MVFDSTRSFVLEKYMTQHIEKDYEYLKRGKKKKYYFTNLCNMSNEYKLFLLESKCRKD